MEQNITADLRLAHDEVVIRIRTIPDAALDWKPDNEAWSLRQILGHLAHANDFYMMIIDEARATQFGDVRLHPGLAGWHAMSATDAAVAECTTVQAMLDCFQRTFWHMLDIVQDLQPAELDREFRFSRPNAEPWTTTLRQRVLAMAAEHIREHQSHLSETLAAWHLIQDQPQTQIQ
jgi:hypothetical protein